MKSIDPRTFDGLTRLEKLCIRSPSLQKTPDLSSVGITLRIFRLSNFGGVYKNFTLKPLVSLDEFSMVETGLVHIPEDIRYIAASLCVLILRNNRISTLDNMYDILFPKLREVWLEFNNISHLNPKLLRLPVLQAFSIRNNQITQIPDLSDSVWGIENEGLSYARFYPANNPLHCNGSMLWLGKSICRMSGEIYFRRLMLAINLDNLFCQSPTEVQGRAVVPVDELNVDEIAFCRECHNIPCMIAFVSQDPIRKWWYEARNVSRITGLLWGEHRVLLE